MSKDTGGPVFPQGAYKGLNVRDYFAAQAMQGLMVGTEEPNTTLIAEMAYAMADDMLKERTS